VTALDELVEKQVTAGSGVRLQEDIGGEIGRILRRFEYVVLGSAAKGAASLLEQILRKSLGRQGR